MKSVTFLLALIMLFLTAACNHTLFSSNKSKDEKNKNYYEELSTKIKRSKVLKVGIMENQTGIPKSSCTNSYTTQYSNSYACYVLIDILKECSSQLSEKNQTKIVKIVEKQCT
jgi:hypothetical protein